MVVYVLRVISCCMLLLIAAWGTGCDDALEEKLCIYIYIYTYIHTYIHVYICVYIYIYVYTHTYHMYKYTYIYIYIYTLWYNGARGSRSHASFGGCECERGVLARAGSARSLHVPRTLRVRSSYYYY